MGMRASVVALTAARPDGAQQAWRLFDAPGVLDIDKAWHGLHRLLERTQREVRTTAGEAILGGEPVGPEDAQPMLRRHAPARVAAIAQALAAIPRAGLAARHDPAAMDAASIPPSIWTRDGQEGAAFLLGGWDGLVRLDVDAAGRGDAVATMVR